MKYVIAFLLCVLHVLDVLAMRNLTFDKQDNTKNVYMITEIMKVKTMLPVNVYGEAISFDSPDNFEVTVTMDGLLSKDANNFVNFLTNTNDALYKVLVASQDVRKKLSLREQDLDVQNLLTCLPLYFNRNADVTEDVAMKTCVNAYKKKFESSIITPAKNQHLYTAYSCLVVMLFLSLPIMITKNKNSFVSKVIMAGECAGAMYALYELRNWYQLWNSFAHLNGSVEEWCID